jgi:hypothetical protein
MEKLHLREDALLEDMVDRINCDRWRERNERCDGCDYDAGCPLDAYLAGEDKEV